MARYLGTLLTALLFIAAHSAVAFGEQVRPMPDMSRAHSYIVVDEQDFSAGYGRTRKSLCIASTADTYIARAHTIIRAAVDLQKRTGADYVQVAMTPIADIGCSDYFTAIAEHSPDGGGVAGNLRNHYWQVQATDIVLDIEERLVLRAWQEVKADFETDGEVDTEGIARHLARQLNLSPEEVKNFWLRSVEMTITLRDYMVK